MFGEERKPAPASPIFSRICSRSLSDRDNRPSVQTTTTSPGRRWSSRRCNSGRVHLLPEAFSSNRRVHRHAVRHAAAPDPDYRGRRGHSPELHQWRAASWLSAHGSDGKPSSLRSGAWRNSTNRPDGSRHLRSIDMRLLDGSTTTSPSRSAASSYRSGRADPRPLRRERRPAGADRIVVHANVAGS